MLAGRKRRAVHRADDDLELTLYSAIFGNDFLHYGYFAEPPSDPEKISLADVKQAMVAYADLIVGRVPDGARTIDLGCGMGGLIARLDARGIPVTGVTPDSNQIRHIATTWPHVPLVQAKVEDLEPSAFGTFGRVINSESFQYVDIDRGMPVVRDLLDDDGRWIVTDYFRIAEGGRNTSGHKWDDFVAGLERYGLEIVEHLDITENVLPNLAYGHMLATRFALPLARFGTDRFFRRRPFLDYVLHPLTAGKLDKVRLDTLDPETFRRHKRYLLLTIAKK